MVGLYYDIQEMGSFPMSVANNFCDLPLPKYLDSKTVLIYCPHPVFQQPDVLDPKKAVTRELDYRTERMKGWDPRRLKVTQAWEFFGFVFEFFTFLWLVMPNYYFLEIFFHWTNIREAMIIPRILRIRGKRFFLQVRWKNLFFQKTQIWPLLTL